MTKRPDLRVIEDPPMSEFDQSIIGTHATRIHLPFRNLYHMRRYAELLRAFADDLDFTARRQDHPAIDTRDYQVWRRQMLFYLKMRAREINRRIREIDNPEKDDES